MKFGPVPIREAVGGTLAHALKEGALTLKKGTIIADAHVQALFEAGVAEVVVARPEPGDIGENEAAQLIAASAIDVEVVAETPFTGRVNLFAASPGILRINEARIHAANRIDDAITVATLPDWRKVAAGEMVATVKIIPFAVQESLAARAAEAVAGAVRVAPFAPKRVAVVSTLLPGLKATVVEKTLRVLDERLAGLDGASRLSDIRVHHEIDDLKEALVNTRALGADITIVFGASAITDRRDVIPAALEAAGGEVRHLGMPVDPGNLLMLGSLDGRPVLGAPGCARSPKENGFDWVLQRLAADIDVTGDDIRAMGVGGLLMEIITRPQPRDPDTSARPKVAAVVLAAGRGTRMGGAKMTALLGGRPLVRYPHEAAAASRAEPLVTVVGHQSETVFAALAGIDSQIVENPRFEDGMSTSLQAGLASLPESVAGAVILLGDMPHVTPAIIDRLLDAFAAAPSAHAVVPVVNGQRGNPILLARRLFPEVMKLSGDVGARRLLAAAGDSVVEVPIDDAAVLTDVDTPEALAALDG